MTAAAGAVILAAGAGRRLGGVAKALLPGPGGVTFLAAVWAAARAGGCVRAVVVIGGDHAAATRAEAERLGLDVATNLDPARGMASSVAVGFASAVDRWQGIGRALLWPVDHPRVEVATVAALVADDGAITVPEYRGRGGHPTAFAAAVWPELAACDRHPDGARGVVRADANRVVRMCVQDAGVVGDVDTPDDLS